MASYEDPVKKAARRKRYYEHWKAEGRCTMCQRNPADSGLISCASCRAKVRDANLRHSKRQRDRLKDAAYAAYGGYRCACCGEAERCFLSIDHKNNDGARHRGVDIYHWLSKNGYPDGFQILCHNCNRGRYFNGGKCPHKSPQRNLLPVTWQSSTTTTSLPAGWRVING